MKTKETLPDLAFSSYADMMAEEVRKRAKPTKILPADMDPAERAAAILAMQPASTRKMMEMTDEERIQFHATPISKKDAQVAQSAEEMEKYERKLSLEEVSHFEATRRRPKNTVGQSELSSVSALSRDRAVDAFMFSPGIPADKLSAQDHQRLSQISPYSAPVPLMPKAPAPSWFQRLKTFFTAGARSQLPESLSYVDVQEIKARSPE